jgi:hypothetical protein
LVLLANSPAELAKKRLRTGQLKKSVLRRAPQFILATNASQT